MQVNPLKLLAGAMLVLLPQVALAAQLKIYDGRGILRAVKEVSGFSSVYVSIPNALREDAASGKIKIALEAVDGIASPKAGEFISDRFFFKKIVPGSWKISGAISGISAVEITKAE